MKITSTNIRKINNIINNEIYNTWCLSSNITPIFEISENNLVIKTLDKNVQINYVIECLLRTLCVYPYVPLWYFQEQMRKYSLDEEDWINVLIQMNILYAENLANGIFLRPTVNLYKLFKIPSSKYKPIMYNMLTHDLSKFDVMFNCLNGTQEDINNILIEQKIKDKIFKIEDFICKQEAKDYSVLNLLDGNETEEIEKIPMKIIDECNIKISRTNLQKISQIDNIIIEELQQGNIDTYELHNYNGFYVSFDDGNDTMIQFPDIIIPMHRNKDGSPNSVAIEMEITAKAQSHYDKNVKKYKNNLKYGSVIWFVDDIKTKNRIYEAYKKIGGTGMTKTYVISYTTPREYIMRKLL